MITREDYPMWMTAEETAQVLRVHITTVYDLAKQGKLPIMKIGRTIRINRDKLFEKGASA